YMRCWENVDGLVCNSEGDEEFAEALRLLAKFGYIDVYYNKGTYVVGDLRLSTIEKVKSKFPVIPDIMIWKAESLTPADFEQIYERTGLRKDDVDYIALIKRTMETPTFMEEGTAYGCCYVKRRRWDTDYDIVIGYHS
ncbi:MAG: hypothetical protein J7L51_00070, partial [Desulfurococcales archaeon]|nr:hypothetical protein [Desulfurococcales archaeon]